MVQGQVRRDAPQPRGKIRFRIKSRMRFVRAPKSLHGQILRCRRIAHDAHHPAIHLALVLPKKRCKGVQIARRESLQQFHAPPPSYLYLPWISSKRYIYFCALPTVSSKGGMNMSTLRVRMVLEILSQWKSSKIAKSRIAYAACLSTGWTRPAAQPFISQSFSFSRL